MIDEALLDEALSKFREVTKGVDEKSQIALRHLKALVDGYDELRVQELRCRKYLWYSPEIDALVVQIIMSECSINFEWGPQDLYEQYQKHGHDYLMSTTVWIPIGEIEL